jgi:hypothetical protein
MSVSRGLCAKRKRTAAQAREHRRIGGRRFQRGLRPCPSH